MRDISVDVLVTFYNQEQYVDQALESVFAQKGTFGLHVLIGDDGSQDNTLGKIQTWCEKYPDQIVKKDRQTFLVPKRCVSVREPYSAERRKAASERAKAAGYRPPTPKKGNE